MCADIFVYLKSHDRSWIVFDDRTIEVIEPEDQTSTLKHAEGMKLMYPDAQEELPHNIPEPRGEPIQINVFVDADHASCVATRHYVT